ncbi:apolipoprotein F [Oenanthe melanoleuca]|uniref:apolipoprotein F n=1 Tax=Oenanthe melanoleuca TaxID=2939378 RepID=UPI0024C1203A|nr:apolipoprotein F [Oenanthe melanoleuca]
MGDFWPPWVCVGLQQGWGLEPPWPQGVPVPVPVPDVSQLPDNIGYKWSRGSCGRSGRTGQGPAASGATTMPRVLLFLPLLILMAVSGLAAGDQGLLTELLGPPEPTHATAIPCHTLGPHTLPGFSRLPPLPRGLARAALALALRGAGCAPQAEAEALELAQELGTPTAAALLRGLARLPGAPAPRPLALLLLGLARPGGSACVDLHGTGPTPPTRGLPGVRLCRRRREGEDTDACSPAGEREAHQVLEWVPGVSIFYNLGTSVYFAFQGCKATASTRALEAAEDLGYAGLAALTGGLGGPVAMGVQMGLQPGIKAGVRALVGYFTSAGEPSPVPTAHSGPVVIV